MTEHCPWCDGVCTGADLDPLLTPDLSWFWRQVADAADRRGDASLCTGTLTLTAPASAEERAAAAGLAGGLLKAGQKRQLELADLTRRVQIRGPNLNPGAVAAHAVRRRLAAKAIAKAERTASEELLLQRLRSAVAGLPDHVTTRIEPETMWQRLTSAGTVTRLVNRGDALELIGRAGEVLAKLPAPGDRADRRTLVRGAPHALDEGMPLAWIVLALLGANAQRPRRAWDSVGVDIDDLTGGLLTLGIQPEGWHIPAGAALTLPPRVLEGVRWPGSADSGWVFVTENPSVVAAALDRAVIADNGARVRLVCTIGTPSDIEITAIGALADAGWKVAVRADFDPAGLFHVRSLLAGCKSAVPWRMDATTYRTAAATISDVTPLDLTSDDTPWDPTLGPAMKTGATLVFEEDLLEDLLKDLRSGQGPVA
jgi:uncharacterized protein (TIGR02679 family)